MNMRKNNESVTGLSVSTVVCTVRTVNLRFLLVDRPYSL